jgi:hypothetical protein
MFVVDTINITLTGSPIYLAIHLNSAATQASPEELPNVLMVPSEEGQCTKNIVVYLCSSLHTQSI